MWQLIGISATWQKNPEARKMPVNAANSQSSGARFVGRPFRLMQG
jgi:hypothetical protein